MMEQTLKILVVVTLCVFAVNATADVVVKPEPLTWEKTARLNGEDLYGNLCAACHGATGAGDGPAAHSVGRAVPSLRMFAANNGGVFDHNEVERMISGESRKVAHGEIDMPNWQRQFMYFRTGLNSFQREAYARNRIHVLAEHVETLQLE